MQMYKVSFRAKRGAVLDVGTYLVCAGSVELAEQSVSAHLGIPMSGTTFDTGRVKPSIYELKRSEYTETKLPQFVTSVADVEDGAVYEVRASAKVFGHSESSVLRRFANAVIENASALKTSLPKHINDFSVEVERADERVRASKVEEQSIYKEKRFFAGGAARPR